ncbi:hypothetical protein RIF29_17943 [Crotalaria pallida]|uniref:Uncharacterized protein n=1 Tax=Crotalaria pallida TaxID=3830 RepID=A0AAN9FI30_CROPI
MSMGELKGFLYICEACPDEDIRIWVMKKYGVGEWWSKVFSIGPMDSYPWPYGLYWPLKLFKKSTALLMYHSCNCLFYYDPKYGFKFFEVQGTRSKFEAIPLIPSLISLKDVVKGDNVEVLNVHSGCGKFKLREEKEVLYLAEENAEISLDEWWWRAY